MDPAPESRSGISTSRPAPVHRIRPRRPGFGIWFGSTQAVPRQKLSELMFVCCTHRARAVRSAPRLAAERAIAMGPLRTRASRSAIAEREEDGARRGGCRGRGDSHLRWPSRPVRNLPISSPSHPNKTARSSSRDGSKGWMTPVHDFCISQRSRNCPSFSSAERGMIERFDFT